MLASFYFCVVASYAMAYFIISGLGGNIFINCIVISLAGAFSIGTTGLAMIYFKDTTVSRFCSILMALFNAIHFYCTGPNSTLLQYFVLFLALVGHAGVYNCIFVIIELRIPPKNLASATNIIMLVIGPMSYGILPYIQM